MRIVPDSTVSLYRGVDIDSGEQLVFSSKANQTAYFQLCLERQAVACTVVRKTGALRLECPGSVVSRCNYLSFINPSFDNKIVYARIVDYDYINNECTEITYMIDYWQTWMFDVQFDDMYIEREHLSQADWLKAENNPYDPSILEFRTSENLPISLDCEKPNYSIGESTDDDGAYVGRAFGEAQSLGDGIGALIYLAEIDFEKLDSQASAQGSTLPSSAFVSLWVDIAQDPDCGLTFMRLTDAQYTYLNATYPQQITAQYFAGSDWGQLGRLPSSNFVSAPYTYMYIDHGADYGQHNVGYTSRLLMMLTRWSAVEQIVGIYAVPRFLIPFAGLAAGNHETINYAMGTSASQLVDSKKLDLYPYSYIRAIAPNGDKKEYHMEDFVNVQNKTILAPSTGVDAMFSIVLDIMEKPTLIIMPREYRMTGEVSYRNVEETNPTEALVFGQFPQLPYTIDAFVANIAAVANANIASNTLETQYNLEQFNLNNKKQVVSEVGGGGVGIVSSILNGDAKGFGESVANFAFGYEQYDINKKRYELEQNQRTGAYYGLADTEHALNAIYDNFKYTKPAYACNKYVMGNGDGTINYNVLSVNDIMLLRVQLHPTILANYDRYFKNYGYNSGRCGIPRVISYTQGDTSPANTPHWELISNKYTTYIKTMDCKVTYSMLPVASYIKSMFDAGVRMIQGDHS